MSSSIGSQIVSENDGTSTGIWGAFVLKSAFQPIFGFQAGKLAVAGFEALLRPFRAGELLQPMTFLANLPAAERIVVENLLHRLHLLNAAAFLPADAAIFINIDPSVFIDHAVADAAIRDMRATLAEIGADPHRVVCEVTEKETISQEALFNLVAGLRASGFRIAVDDYGADDSDMARIRDLHPDIVKFDAAWVGGLIDSAPGYALLAEMVSTFEQQGIRTVFEGIEKSWQIELAEKAGVAMLQGFALARPELVPASFARPGSADSGAPHRPNGGSPARAGGDPHHVKTFGRRAGRP